MKLIYCPSCHDVLKLKVMEERRCECEKSYGWYHENGASAEIGGDAISLGIANRSFVRAVAKRPKRGEGSRFDAFVIPVECDTIERAD